MNIPGDGDTCILIFEYLLIIHLRMEIIFSVPPPKCPNIFNLRNYVVAVAVAVVVTPVVLISS